MITHIINLCKRMTKKYNFLHRQDLDLKSSTVQINYKSIKLTIENLSKPKPLIESNKPVDLSKYSDQFIFILIFSLYRL